jgi:hypothetical protein
MTTVLITQCLQRDFANPISRHDPLPNLLHVGYSETARLVKPARRRVDDAADRLGPAA